MAFYCESIEQTLFTILLKRAYDPAEPDDG